MTAPRRYDHTHTAAAFLLGGIGTGNVSLGSRGELRDWEIFGTAGKGNVLPNTFFALRTDDGTVNARVLEAQFVPPYGGSHGYTSDRAAGLTRFPAAVVSARYPFVRVEFTDPALPVTAELEAFTPFVPLNADDSGIPAALLTYRITNRSSRRVSVSVMGSLTNFSTLARYHRHTWGYWDSDGDVVNEYRDQGGLRGLFLRPARPDAANRHHGSLALTTTAADATHKRAWLNGGWWDGLQECWDDFVTDGRLEAEPRYREADGPAAFPDSTGSLCLAAELAPGEGRDFPFILSWSFPLRVGCWSERMYREVVLKGEAGDVPTARHWYGLRYPDAWTAAADVTTRRATLEDASRAFADALYGSTMPEPVIDAVAATMTVLRSPTAFRLADGTFHAWEGCFDDDGCCEGTCTHVWNYAQTVAWWFPELERSARRNEYLVETRPDGKMNFRSYIPFGLPGHDHVPAADGQMGTFVRLYREWLLSGDDAFLRELWPAAVRTLDFAQRWDGDGDGVLDTDQFNTYDIAFQGPSSLVNSLYLAALKAGVRMAGHLGEVDRAARWQAQFERASAGLDAALWNGEYYAQRLDAVDQHRYQYGAGCLSDQLFGQTLAHLCHLGHLLPPDHVRSAIHAVYRHNRHTADHPGHTQRTYRLNGEPGLLLCTWPRGGRPRLPFPYSDEVWSGIEYQVATHLAFEGFADEAVELVAAVRSRHDGKGRNPWNEVECGHHYARSLASWGVWVALSGVEVDLPARTLRFRPQGGTEVHCLFSAGQAWGVYHRTAGADGRPESRVEWLGGDPGRWTIDG